VAIYALRYFAYATQLQASILNAIIIQVYNLLYTTVAFKLTDQENHRTSTQYENHLTAKVFAFQFVNNYASFFYLAFIAHSLNQCKTYQNGACMEPLATNLLVILLTNLTVGNAAVLLQPFIMLKLAMRRRGFKNKKELKTLTAAEREYLHFPYDPVVANLERFSNAAIIFGFMTIFVTTLPLSVLLASLCVYGRLKGDSWLMMRVFQRPRLEGVQDIGVWYSLLRLQSQVAVASNAGITMFTMTSLDSFSTSSRYWLFIGYMVACYATQFFIEEIVPDEPIEFTHQKARNEFLDKKIVDKEPDGEDEEETEGEDEEEENDNLLGNTREKEKKGEEEEGKGGGGGGGLLSEVKRKLSGARELGTHISKMFPTQNPVIAPTDS